ncbi:MAG: phosphoribosylamine--glycine ligase [Cyclobacteriaceae bacterium]|nr:phosphoribosylamine--glycine ligase [Cyclobacteriaceae bacterium]
MNILLVGSGGREHALAWKIRQSSRCRQLYIAPGNAGTAREGINVSIPADDFPALADFCLKEQIQLVVVGPEAPLVAGLRDYFEQRTDTQHIAIVGPGKAGARLEGSKNFSKAFMLRHHIPTARARTFSSSQLNEALAYLDEIPSPYVIKADGLAAGKGVIITSDKREASHELTLMLSGEKFGNAGTTVLIEEHLSGIELSVFILTDGTGYVILPEAKDYKRIGDGDTGPNTGGMGAVSPVPFADTVFMKKVEERIILPTLRGLQSENISYRGFIFIGLMNVKGNPYVIEYNCRMGDPETQAVMPRIESDLVDLLWKTATGTLDKTSIRISPLTAVTVVMAAGGYPGDFKKNNVINGLDKVSNALCFHAGTKQLNGNVVTQGGRVLAVTGMGNNLDEARKTAYSGVSEISWTDAYFRKDIGMDILRYY